MRKRMVVFVVGTGTDAGKTHVAAALAHAARASGELLVAKPIETGVPNAGLANSAAEGADSIALRRAAGQAARLELPHYTFPEPISPHLAARLRGDRIDVLALARAISSFRSDVDLLVESAGGFFSPLNETMSNGDLARALGNELRKTLRLLLVAPNRIGVLHDVTATVRAAKAMGVSLPLIALSAAASTDASTESNATELVHLGVAKLVVSFPRAPFDAPESMLAAKECLAALRDHDEDRA